MLCLYVNNDNHNMLVCTDVVQYFFVAVSFTSLCVCSFTAARHGDGDAECSPKLQDKNERSCPGLSGGY